MPASWHDLIGIPGQVSGTAGTALIPSGAVVVEITVHASSNGATFTLFGGPPVSVVNGANPLQIQFNHTLFQSNSANGGTIVFTGTDHYWVHYVYQSWFRQPFDPATLPLSIWERDYAGAPWSSAASAGASGGRSMIAGTAPTIDTPLNGHGVALMASATLLTASVNTGSLVTASAWSAWALINPSSTAGFHYVFYVADNADSSLAQLGINAGSAVLQMTTGAGAKVASSAVSASAWNLVQCRYNGTNLSVRVNGGAWVNTTSGSLSGTLNGNFYLGVGVSFSGDLAEVALSPTALSDADFNNVLSYARTRYAQALP